MGIQDPARSRAVRSRPSATADDSPQNTAAATGSPNKAVAKVGLILDAFRRQGPELPLRQIADAASLEISTASRIVSSMVQAGLLRYDPVQRLYSPGLITLELSRVVLNRFGFRELAHRELIALSSETGWECYLAIADENDDRNLIYIDAVSTRSPEQSEIGQRRPMHSTATGKALLAFRETSIHEWALQPSTPHTHTDTDALEIELKEVRDRGYAVSQDEEQLEVCSAAAPIFDSDGRVVAVLGLGTTDADFAARRSQLIDAVVNKARGISSALRLSQSAATRDPES